MSARLSFVDRSSATCRCCGQATFHIRGICRTCDPCTATLILAVAEASLSVDRTLEPPGIQREQPDGRSTECELAA